MRKKILRLVPLLLGVGLGFNQPGRAQLATQCVTTALAGGTADTITVPRLPCVPTTTLLILKTISANATTTPTIQVTGSPAQKVKRSNGTPLAVGDLQANSFTMLTNNGSDWLLFSSWAGGISPGAMSSDIWPSSTRPPSDAWMNTQIPIPTGGAYKYLVPISTLLVMNTTASHGQVAITGASRTSDSPDTCCTMGGAFAVINDNTAKPQSAWPLYVTGAKMPNTGSLQIEVDMANLDPVLHDYTPYAGSAGFTVPLILQSGGEPAEAAGSMTPPAYPVSAMLGLGTNGATARHGIVFGSGLFDYSSCYQITCPAIDMPAGDEIRWVYDPSDTYGSYIRGLNTAPGAGNGIVLTQYGTVFTNMQGQQLAAVINTPGVGSGGFVELTNTGLNGDARIGVATNGSGSSNLQLDALGTGVIVLNAPVQFNTPTLNNPGATQTFGNSPCTNTATERWMPVVLQGLGTWYLALCQ